MHFGAGGIGQVGHGGVMICKQLAASHALEAPLTFASEVFATATPQMPGKPHDV